MRYYVTSDIHSYFTLFKEALTKQGFFEDEEPHKLIICGDLFDRGFEALELQNFIVDLMEKDQVILIRGNHEDLMMELISEWKSEDYFQPFNVTNGTTETVLQLTKSSLDDLDYRSGLVYEKLLETPYIKKIIPAMRDYFETQNYVFVHGWIPCSSERVIYGKVYGTYNKNWRNSDSKAWSEARWINGIEAAYSGIIEENKTIVCGHWGTSFGHSNYHQEYIEGEFNFNPYYDKGIIALDANTAYSGQVNCIVIED